MRSLLVRVFIATALASATLTCHAADERELHVVALYEGQTKTGEKLHGGKALVQINRPGKQVVLVAMAYSPVTWEIAAAPGSRIEKVILGGYHRQAVSGLPKGVEVEEMFHEGRSGRPYVYAGHEVNTPRFRRVVRELRRTTGLEMASFQGRNRYEDGWPFLVDRIQGDPRLHSDYPHPVPASERPVINFKAVHLQPVDRHFLQGSYGDFTAAGPVLNSLRPLPSRVMQVVVDPVSGRHFGITLHEVAELDMAGRTAEPLQVGMNVPRPSWLRGITFDAKRQRLVFVASRVVYAYSIQSREWSVLFETDRSLHLTAIAHDYESDGYYGLAGSMPERGGQPTLYRFNSHGAVVSRLQLPEPMLPGLVSLMPGSSVQMIAVKDGLAILVSPGMRMSEDQGDDRSFLFLVDPKSGQVRVTWKSD